MPSLPEAVESKYGQPYFDVQIGVVDVSCLSLSLRGCGNFRPPSVLILAGCDIEEAGDENELRRQCNGVTELDLSKNKFKKWEEIDKLGATFPCLEALILADCPIEVLDQDTNFEGNFPSLRYLSLNNCKISSWESIDIINKLKELRELRLHQCPLFQAYSDNDRRQLTIARLEFLQRLNGGANISHEEREDAERAFVRHYITATDASLPKRYHELVRKHGHLDPLVNVSLKPQTTVTVTIKCEEKCFEKELSVYMKVADMKKALESELGFPCFQMRIFYVDKANGPAYAPEELKINSKQLYTLNVNTGDEFIIDSKLPQTDEAGK